MGPFYWRWTPSATLLLRYTAAALSLLVVSVVAPAAAFAAGAAIAPTTPRVAILSLSTSLPNGVPLPAAGARVVVTVRVRGATTCLFLEQHGAFSSLYPVATVRCASGRASVTMPSIANASGAPAHLTYAVRARGIGQQTVQRSVTLTQAARSSPDPVTPPPATPVAPTAALSISATTIPSTGGTVTLQYTSANASSCSLASAPAFWTASNPLAADCNGTYAAIVNPSETAQQWTFTFIVTGPGGQTATASQTLSELAAQKPTPPAGALLSENWSGYAIPPSGAPVTFVSGRWTVPTLDCSVTPDAGASIWVGIGGYGGPTGDSSATLLQTGVRTDCIGGVAQYAGWFEEYPSNPNTSKDFAGFSVSPGDLIEATVFQGSTGAWETRVDDLTTGLSGVMVTGSGWGVLADGGNGSFPMQGSTAGLSYPGGYTAEWIVEAYSLNGSDVTLADFGRVDFSDLKTSLVPWYLTASEGIALVQNDVVVSTPSLPAGSGFSVTYTG